jgi:RecA/RadA recombinase
MATKKSPPKEDSVSFKPYSVLDILEEVEKVVKIQSVTLSDEGRLSTGLFTVDLLLGRGGITAGMYTFSGPEQSAKTTLAVTVLANSVRQDVGMRVLWDAENSSGSSADYVENIFSGAGVKTSAANIFGMKENGKYIETPLVYYRDEGEMSTFFDWTSATLRRLPDKRYESGRWWYVYDNDRDTKSKYASVMDRKLSSQNNAIYIPAPSGALQALILVDSWPSLLPDSMDEDDPKSGMALQAREFSKNLPRIKGKLRAKRVAILGINQLREKPGFNMGDPRYETGGQALRFLSDCRIWCNPRSLSGVPFNPKGKGQIEKEESIDGGEDTYRYIHLKAIKNKLSVPGLESWLRIWVSDSTGQARGFCPVWDAFYTLSQTGMVTGKRTSMLLNLSSMGPAKKTITWKEFKILILGTKEQREPIFAKIGYKNLDIRAGLGKMLASGKLERMFLDLTRSGTKPVDEDDDDGDEV